MKERISQLASGMVDLEVPTLELFNMEIDETIAAGQKYRGDIRISSGNGLPFRGLIYSEDSRVLLLQGSFAGSSVEIPYEVHAEYLEAGSSLTGHFSIVYNGGIRQIPYCFHLRRPGSGRQFSVQTLEDFTRLYRERPEQALELYSSRDFQKLPLMEDMSLRAVYDGLYRAANHRGAVEEFLIAAGAKERVRISMSESAGEVLTEGRNQRRCLKVTRSGWGQLRLQVSSDNEAVAFAEGSYTDADFRGDELEIPYTVLDEKLHQGRNFARLRVKSDLMELEYALEIKKSRELTPGAKQRLARQRNTLEFAKYFFKVMAQNEKNDEDLDYLELYWEEMIGDEEPAPRQKLYRAAIGLFKGDKDLTSMILEDVVREITAGRREDPDAFLAYLWLQQEVTENWEQKEQLIRILRQYEEEGRETLFGLLLKIHMDEGAMDRPREVLSQLEDYWHGGYRSPFLYLSAIKVVNIHPDVIRHIDAFECQILHFGAKTGLLTEDAAVYAASLSSQTKASAAYTSALKELYALYPRDEILGAVCAMLIKKGEKDEQAFAWFEKGVARDIRLTKLYDFYLYTFPSGMDKALPREIVLYFSYNSPRDPEARKKLYRNLLDYYSGDPEITASYGKQMREFTASCMLAGAIDSDLAFLYENLLELSDVDERSAKILPDLINSWEITADLPGITDIIVVYGELGEELSVPLKEGRAYAPIYSDSCRLLMAAADGTRYYADGIRKRMVFTHREALAKRCSEVGSRHAMMRLAAAGQALAKEKRSEADLRLLRREIEIRDIHPQFRKAMINAVVNDCIRQDDPKEEDILTCIRYADLTSEQKDKLTGILIRMGRFNEAGLMVQRGGFRRLDPHDVEKLAVVAIGNNLFGKSELLLDMTSWLFRKGCRDEVVLEYLCAHYNSASRDMIPVLAESDLRGLNTGDMPERLLGQMLFTGEDVGLDQVFAIYRRSGEVNRLLVHAYFVLKCSEYFSEGQEIGEDVFHLVEELMTSTDAGQIPRICEMALLRSYSEREELTDDQLILAGKLLAKLLRRGDIFGWMKKFEGRLQLPEDIRCREFVEYCTDADQHLELVVSILPEMKDKPVLRLALPQVYRGIYGKSFLLYEGDELRFEIRSEDGKLESSGVIYGKASDANDHTRYAELNRLQKMVRDPHVADWQEEVSAYAAGQTLVSKLFRLPEDEDMTDAK